ncbi:MAG: glucose-1-phosphate adenylyltransferase, partial [Planctomycetaceae bacterium]|nr:glucose-1-phosphate adenylyltransferase [Planctomycetaceae bacterium]
LFDNVQVARGAKIKNAIIDKDVTIPENEAIGYDLERDRNRGFTVTENGITVVAKQVGPSYFV